MTTVPNTLWHPCEAADHGARPATRRVVIHTIEGTAAGALSWFANRQRVETTGAQLVIGLDHAYQTMNLDHIAWHARNANHDGVGVEHEGSANDRKRVWLSKRKRKQLRMSANRVAWICYHYRMGRPSKGHNVFGHRDIPGNDHVDPDAHPPLGFPWLFYMLLCRRAYKNLVNSGGRKWS